MHYGPDGEPAPCPGYPHPETPEAPPTAAEVSALFDVAAQAAQVAATAARMAADRARAAMLATAGPLRDTLDDAACIAQIAANEHRLRGESLRRRAEWITEHADQADQATAARDALRASIRREPRP